MQYIGILVILFGAYLLDSGIKNRDPIGFARALIEDPSDLRGTLDEFNGKWTTPLEEVREEKPANYEPSTGLGSSEDPQNGRLPASALTRLSWTVHKVANAAAPSLELLNAAYRAKFGHNITVTDGYRTYAGQVAAYAAKPNLAAKPGTSNHGLGLAVDLGGGINRFGTSQYEWMMDNAPKYGWVNPSWAVQGGKKPEPWHWEFVGGVVSV